MKNIKINLFIILIILFLLFPNIVLANDVKNINMDVYIQNNGTASIIEKWDTYSNEHKEFYKSYGNLGNSKIEDFTVSMDGEMFEQVNNWNVDADFKTKAYHYGLNNGDNNTIELCWGISEYGNHTYTLMYNITNFVTNLNDSDIVYWQLIPPGMDVKKININVYSDGNNNLKDSVWGYGKYGAKINVNDNYLNVLISNKDEKEYMTLLIKYNKNTFITNNIKDKSFNYYKNLADKDAEKYEKDKVIGSIILIITLIIAFLPFAIIVIYALNALLKHNIYNCKTDDKVPYIRDIPKDMKLSKSIWIVEKFNLNNENSVFMYTDSIILKMIYENNIKINVVEHNDKKKLNLILDKNAFNSDVKYEQEIFNIIYNNSENGIISEKKYKRCLNRNYGKIVKVINNIIEEEEKELINSGDLIVENKKRLKHFKYKYLKSSSKITKEANNLKGLKEFLVDFSNIDDRKMPDIKLWEYYLIYAQMFGIAKEVIKEFEQLFPELKNIKDANYTYSDYIYVSDVSSECISSISTSYSSGSGGGGASGSGGSMGSR